MDVVGLAGSGVVGEGIGTVEGEGSTIFVQNGTTGTRGFIVGECAVGNGLDGAPIEDGTTVPCSSIFEGGLVAVKDAVGDQFDLPPFPVIDGTAVTGLVAFERGATDLGDGALVTDGTALAIQGCVANELAVFDCKGGSLFVTSRLGVVDGPAEFGRVLFERYAVDRQLSTVGVVDGAGGLVGRVAFKAAAGDGQRAIIPESTSLMARELGVGDGRFALSVNGKLVDRAAAGHAACKGRNAVFTDCDHVASCGIILFKRDGAFNGTLFDGHTASVGNGALTVDIFDSDRDALIDIHDTAIEREFVEGSVLLVFRF